MSNRFQSQSNNPKNSQFSKSNIQNQDTQNLYYRRPQPQNYSSNSLQNTQNSYMTNEIFLNTAYSKIKHNNSANDNPKPEMENSIKPTILDTSGNRPFPRFGQSLVSISPVKLLLFGGAVGDVKNFRFSNDVYLFNLMTYISLKNSFFIRIFFSKIN